MGNPPLWGSGGEAMLRFPVAATGTVTKRD
jgi:hypothetical protein